MSKQRISIVGAGISGLAAARGAVARAREAGREVEITVFEREAVPGGKARTLREGGWLLETGPTGWLDNEPIMDRLVGAAGLVKLPADDAAARRFLVREGRLREIKAHPLKFFGSGILSPGGALRIATEPFRRKLVAKDGGSVDESVWEFAARRLGKQAADRMIAPMVLGVFAGDAQRISLPAAFPRMAELEAEYGSLIKALIALKKKKGKQSGGPGGPSGKLTSFAGGLDELPIALAARAEENHEFSVRTGVTVSGLGHDGSAWRLRLKTAGGEQEHACDAVVLAGECYATADLLRPLRAPMADEIAAIPTPPVAVVGLGYGPEVLARAPKGFGALIQRGGAERILGVLWDTHLFAGRSPDGCLLMRAMIGGRMDEASGRLDDAEIAEIARTDIARLFGLDPDEARPRWERVVRWPRAIPQFEVGHLDRIRRVREHLSAITKERPGLALAGNWLDGVAFAKAAKTGWDAGESLVAPR